MNARVLRRVFTAKQMLRGEGMIYHPVTGDRLKRLTFLSAEGVFAAVIALPFAHPLVVRRCRQIGERRKYYAYGDAYPTHWAFDPWTGERL